nr:MAG TPA: hypothetical protein [Caudoviricetes sp.]
MKSYLVYKSSFDSDFDNCSQIYILGLYKEEAKAIEICAKDLCKNTFYKQINNNEQCFIQLN